MNVTFHVLVKTQKTISFCKSGKKFVEIKIGYVFNKSYMIRYYDSARFMKESLDTPTSNLSNSIYKIKYKLCMKCKYYKECKDDSKEWCNK